MGNSPHVCSESSCSEFVSSPTLSKFRAGFPKIFLLLQLRIKDSKHKKISICIRIHSVVVGYWSERGKIRVSNPVPRCLSLYFICWYLSVVWQDSWLSTSPFPLNRTLCYRVTPKLYLQRPVFLWNLKDGCMQKSTAFFQKLTFYVNTVCWSM